MKRLTLFIALLAFCSMQFLSAQNRQISGVVTSAQDNSLLPGASITVLGTTIGTITSADGSFTLDVPENATTIVVSFIGMKTQEIEIGNLTSFEIALQSDLLGLEEVMVVAYGTSKKYSFTGSASNVSSSVLENKPVTDLAKALQGSASGLQITTASGQPGAQTSVRIRGYGSAEASSAPLYVIDGVAIESGNFSEVTNEDDFGTTSDILSTLNPNDIESVTVLKDASAASLYGSRAANGVIIITTKKGHSGKTKFNAFAQTGLSDRAVQPYDMMNTAEYYSFLWNGLKDTQLENGATPETAAAYADSEAPGIAGRNPYSLASPYALDGTLLPDAEQIIDTDWQDEIFRTGITREYGLSASGGNETTNFYLSGGYYDQEGIVLGSDFDRYSAKLNLKNEATDFLTIGMNSSLSYTTQNTPMGSGQAASPNLFAFWVPGTNPLYDIDENGDFVLVGGNKQYNWQNPVMLDFNPVALSEMNIMKSSTGRAISSIFGELKIFKNLRLKSILAVDYLTIEDITFDNQEHGNGAAVGGRGDFYDHTNIMYSSTNTLVYNKSIGANHNINMLIGQEAIKTSYRRMNAHGTSYPFGGIYELIASSTPVTASSYTSEYSMLSYFSRFNYDFSDKYYISLSYRKDGSSRFGTETRYGDFYSVGATWRLTEESFIPKTDVLNNLKLRASYGTSGNHEIGNYQAKGLFSYGFNYAGRPGMAQTQLANPLLTWEKNANMDIAVEFGLFNTLSGSVNYYNRISDGLLLLEPLSYSTGFEGVVRNTGELLNSGIEIDLKNVNLQTQNITWITSINITSNKNEWTSLPQEEILEGSKLWKVGSGLYEYYIKEWAGVDPATGEAMWYMDIEDEDGEPTGERTLTKNYSEADRYQQGAANPKLFGGLSNSFNYKGIFLDFSLYFSYGGQILDYDLMDVLHDGARPEINLTKDVYDAWKSPGDITTVPKYVLQNGSNSNSRSTRFLHDASYLRVKNISLGYDLPSNIVSKANMQNIRIFAQADNYFTFAKYKNRDPETRLSGNPDWDIPLTKTITIGIKLGL